LGDSLRAKIGAKKGNFYAKKIIPKITGGYGQHY
jgi:hypothetical protein